MEVIEDVGLDSFVGVPFFVRTEAVNLNRDTTSGGAELADEEGHLLIDLRVSFEVALDISAEGSDVGEATAVHAVFEADLIELAVRLLDVFFLLIEVFRDVLDLAKFGEHVLIAESDGVGINQEVSLNPATMAL